MSHPASIHVYEDTPSSEENFVSVRGGRATGAVKRLQRFGRSLSRESGISVNQRSVFIVTHRNRDSLVFFSIHFCRVPPRYFVFIDRSVVTSRRDRRVRERSTELREVKN